MIGRSVGRYRIVAKLGEGGMGSVWKAEDTLLGRSVALKFLPEALAASPEARRRFLREARAASALDHPGIATVFDAAEADGHIYIAFPVIEGETLTERLRRGAIPMAGAVRITLRAAEAIAHAHARGVLHRDITSGNIMVTPEGRVVVVDFGLALPEGTTRLTATSTVMGTVGYMAPEVVQGGEGDRRADLYGLGVVLYELLTGRMPFEGAQREAVLYRVVHEEAQAPSALRSAVPEELDRITLKALAKESKHRYQSSSELIEELELLEKGGALERLDAAEAAPVPLTPWGRWRSQAHELMRRLRRATSSATVRRRAARALLATTVIVVLAIGVALVMARFRLGPFARAPRFTSVAVLPLKNRSADLQESTPLVEGINNELTTKLVKLQGLQVVPWATSQRYGDTKRALTDIARELNVDALVIGTFRKQGDRIHMTIALVDGRKGFQRWADEFEERWSDIFTVQRNIAVNVATQLKGQLSGTEQGLLATPAAHSVEAYEFYLRGADAMGGEDPASLDHALTYFEHATEIDPKLAEAFVGIGAVNTARYYSGEAGQTSLDRAQENFERALEIKPDLAAAKRGLVHIQWENGRSEECLKIGTLRSRESRNIEALQLHGEAYCFGGLPDKAVPVFRRILELDPANRAAHWYLVMSRAWAGQFRESIADGETYRKRFGDDPEINRWTGVSHQLLGEPEQALTDYEKSDEANFPLKLSFLHVQMGHRSQARAMWSQMAVDLERKVAAYPDNFGQRALLCSVYAWLGRITEFRLQETQLLKDVRRMGHVNAPIGGLIHAHLFLGEFERAHEIAEMSCSLGWCEFDEMEKIELTKAYGIDLSDPRIAPWWRKLGACVEDLRARY